MTAPTHKQFSIAWAAIGAMSLYSFGLTEINFYISLIIMVQMGKIGALFPDLDHAWVNVKEKNPITWVINKAIHLTGGKHRSWQTHSIDIALILTFIAYTLPGRLYKGNTISLVNSEVLSILIVGFMLGWLSHLFSDMLTSGGVRLLFFWRRTFEFVPKKIFSFRFNTGGIWEESVYRVSKLCNILLLVICLAFPYIQGVHII